MIRIEQSNINKRQSIIGMLKSVVASIRAICTKSKSKDSDNDDKSMRHSFYMQVSLVGRSLISKKFITKCIVPTNFVLLSKSNQCRKVEVIAELMYFATLFHSFIGSCTSQSLYFEPVLFTKHKCQAKCKRFVFQGSRIVYTI